MSQKDMSHHTNMNFLHSLELFQPSPSSNSFFGCLSQCNQNSILFVLSNLFELPWSCRRMEIVQNHSYIIDS
uniref:Uncharacterized protein n=1 Tax=Setaria italica TaxID=4555 RepID=K3ZBH3_SETIT